MRSGAKQPNIAVTNKRMRSFGLISSRRLGSVVRPGFLVLQGGTEKSFRPRVVTVFKRERDPQISLTHTTQTSHADLNISPTINFNYQQLVRTFTNHFPLFFSNRSTQTSPTAITQNRLTERASHAHAEKRAYFFDSKSVERQLTTGNRSYFILPRSHITSNFAFRPGQDKEGVSPLQRALPAHFSVVNSRSQFLTQSFASGNTIDQQFKSSRFSQQLNRSQFLTVLNLGRNSTEPNDTSAPALSATHSSTTFTTKPLAAISLSLTLPKLQQANQLQQRVMQFFSGPNLTYAKAQQQSSDNIVAALRDLRKSEPEPRQVPFPQIPSIEQLTNQVRTQLERELRIERERRGL